MQPSCASRLTLFAMVVCGVLWCWRIQAQQETEAPMTLLSMLAEFEYPGVELPGGATMSDGATMKAGKRTCVSTRCESILTTADPYEKVVEFYQQKFGIPQEDSDDEGLVDSPYGGGQSVFLQEDSQGRPLSLCVLSINRDRTATTLVISRHENEPLTHIAWSHYVRQ